LSNIVYLFGAGINRGIQDDHGARPPLATDLFVQAFKNPRIGDSHYLEILTPVFDYIKRYWKLDKEALENNAFDLEACYTLLELQLDEAKKSKDQGKIIYLQDVTLKLTILFAETLQENAHAIYKSESFRALGEIIYAQRAEVITFNYDTLIEQSIESASRVNGNSPSSFRGRPHDNSDISDDEIRYSHFNWNRPLSYGVKFDEVRLQRAGISTFVDGERFYAAHPDGLYSNRILKLHGSINWFVYSGIRKNHYRNDTFKVNTGKTLLSEGNWWFNEPAEKDGEIIEPMIITPTLYKQYSNNELISHLWLEAKKSLIKCNKLIVGGYSFPPTDFAVRKLFLEAFENSAPDEIIVINPDTSIVSTIRDLCHFDKPIIVCRDLDEYIKLYLSN
jgi:hypothetical protein